MTGSKSRPGELQKCCQMDTGWSWMSLMSLKYIQICYSINMVWHTVWFWSPIVLARASDIANMWSPHALGCSVCSAKTVVSCRPQSNALSELKTYQWFWLKPQWTMIFRWYFDVWIGHVGWFWAWSNLERPVQTLVHHVHLPLRLMLCMFTSSWRLEPHARNIFLVFLLPDVYLSFGFCWPLVASEVSIDSVAPWEF